MHPGKSLGKDGSKAEHLKAGGYFFLKAVAERFTTYLNLDTVRLACLRSQTAFEEQRRFLRPGELSFYRTLAGTVQAFHKSASESNIRSGGNQQRAGRFLRRLLHA